MTNFEKYKSEITDIEFAVVQGKPTNCDETMCEECFFRGRGYCNESRLEWLKAEHVAPFVNWHVVAVDTPILVSMDGRVWVKRHFARFEKGKVCAWSMGATSWTADDDDDIADWNYAKLAEV